MSKLGLRELGRIHREAIEAGEAAAVACIPVPMTVVQHANPLDDSSPVVKRYKPVASGVCGYAWVNIFPGNCQMANYLKKKKYATKDDYRGGVHYPIWLKNKKFIQSYEKKTAYASAFAKVLRDYGIDAVAQSRLD